MTYKETTDYLFSAAPSFQHVGAAGYKEGLTNTLLLDDHFGHPHRRYRTIHVAGTNGKGSVCHTLAAILQSEGYKVGLYTSPHLTDFRERIRVNGQMIPEQRVIDFVARERRFFEPLHPSFFELTTALAFLYFAEQNVDIAVIEVGLGGRLDCTNIIRPLLSIITNISLDHTRLLGDTLPQIAREKAGIIKHGVPVVIGEALPQTRCVFDSVAREVGAPIIYAEDTQALSTFKGRNWNWPLHGRDRSRPLRSTELQGYCQPKNTRTIVTALDVLNQRCALPVSADAIERGFANVCQLTGLRGRWQQLSPAYVGADSHLAGTDNGSHRAATPTVVCDTGHNVAAWQYLARQLVEQPCRTLRIVFGMVDDKDVSAVIGLLPRHAVFYWAQASTHRAIPATDIQRLAAAQGLVGDAFTTVAEAYAQALRDACSDDFVFVGGSSYVVADLLATIQP